MELLVIGNGFDLEHEFPTRYTDFLKYCKTYKNDDPISDIESMNQEFDDFIQNNVWLKYFLTVTDLDDDKTWIDFEKEIAKVINAAEEKPSCLSISKTRTGKVQIRTEVESTEFISFLSILDVGNWSKSAGDRALTITTDIEGIDCVKSFIDFIYQELRNFARAFEIYCLHINEVELTNPVVSCTLKKELEQIQEKIRSSQPSGRMITYTSNSQAVLKHQEKVKEFKKKQSELSSKIKKRDYLSLSKFDCVLSFNYTNTYERLYGNEKTKYCYIHGKAQDDRSQTNLIFGIDDNLKQGEENQNFEWVKFKKYFQRIILKTGSEYKDWLLPDRSGSHEEHVAHIVGHSLDRTDFDVLYEIFTNPDFKIIIYYYSQPDFEEKVQQVIKLLSYKGMSGRDELIKRVHGSKWTIKFVDQYDETDGLFIKK